jgi:putative DNA primase/helicase
LYQSEREFRPTHQFWFQSNYRPGFDSTDSGNKRRYIEIPFDNDLSTDPLVTFDGKLKIQMRQNPAFLEAVLAWCVQGCMEWREHGLNIPESVEAATAALFAHNDFLREFLTKMCVVQPNERVPVKELWDAYKEWCEGQGEEPAQGRTFNRVLEERGFERKQARIRGIGGKAWTGIRLKEHGELVRDAGSTEGNEESIHSASPIKRFPARNTFTTVLNGKVKAG